MYQLEKKRTGYGAMSGPYQTAGDFSHMLLHDIPLFQKAKHRDKGERETKKQHGRSPVKCDLFLPASVKLDVSIKEANNRRRGSIPAMDSGSDQALPLVIPHNLHQARVAFVHILVQVELQLH